LKDDTIGHVIITEDLSFDFLSERCSNSDPDSNDPVRRARIISLLGVQVLHPTERKEESAAALDNFQPT